MKGQEDHLQISLSHPKKQRQLDISEVPSLTYHKININSNCKGLCFPPREVMIRSPPPAQTTGKRAAKGCGPGERWTPSKACAWKGLWVQLGEDKPPQSLTAPLPP